MDFIPYILAGILASCETVEEFDTQTGQIKCRCPKSFIKSRREIYARALHSLIFTNRPEAFSWKLGGESSSSNLPASSLDFLNHPCLNKLHTQCNAVLFCNLMKKNFQEVTSRKQLDAFIIRFETLPFALQKKFLTVPKGSKKITFKESQSWFYKEQSLAQCKILKSTLPKSQVPEKCSTPRL